MAKQPEKEGLIIRHKRFLKDKPELLQKIKLRSEFRTSGGLNKLEHMRIANSLLTGAKTVPRNRKEDQSGFNKPLEKNSGTDRSGRFQLMINQLSQMEYQVMSIQNMLNVLYNEHKERRKELELLDAHKS